MSDITQKILKEFREKFSSTLGTADIPQSVTKEILSGDLKDAEAFLKKTIKRVRKETRKEAISQIEAMVEARHTVEEVVDKLKGAR